MVELCLHCVVVAYVSERLLLHFGRRLELNQDDMLTHENAPTDIHVDNNTDIMDQP